MNELMLLRIVRKIIIGHFDWTLEELQFQENNPQEVEIALEEVKRKCGLQRIVDDLAVIPTRTTFIERRVMEDSLGRIRRFIATPNAVAMALYADTNVDGWFAIAIFENSSIDIAILRIGDGVFDVCATRWMDSSENITAICHTMLHDVGVYFIGSFWAVADKDADFFDVEELEKVFDCKAQRLLSLSELCVLGCQVQKGILNGTITDHLLLDVISNSIYIEYAGNTVLLLDRDITIPVKKEVMFEIDGNSSVVNLLVRQGNARNMQSNPIIALLSLAGLPLTSNGRQLEITIEIGLGECCIKVEDVLSGIEDIREIFWDYRHYKPLL